MRTEGVRVTTTTEVPSYASHQPLPPGLVNGAELADLSGITYRKIDYWTRVGYLVTESQLDPGSGYQRTYRTTEVPIANMIEALTRGGVGAATAHKMARDFAATGQTVLAGITIHLPEAP